MILYKIITSFNNFLKENIYLMDDSIFHKNYIIYLDYAH